MFRGIGETKRMAHVIYLIHGFNVKDGGAETVDTVRDHLEERGYRVEDIDYGYFQRLRVRLCNKSIARVLAHLVKPGSTCIAHSNGGALAYLACEFGAPFKNVVLVNPALDSKKVLAKQVEKVQVWYSPHDKWTGLAKFIPKSIWGAQGRTGYTGHPDARYENIDQEEAIGRMKDEHSGIWHSELTRKYFADKVHAMIQENK